MWSNIVDKLMNHWIKLSIFKKTINLIDCCVSSITDFFNFFRKISHNRSFLFSNLSSKIASRLFVRSRFAALVAFSLILEEIDRVFIDIDLLSKTISVWCSLPTCCYSLSSLLSLTLATSRF
jgi:hypothetical protein